MANRQQDYRSGGQRFGQNRSRDDDDNRSPSEWERDDGRYADTSEESGSTGRSAGSGGRSTGQDRYGQTGYGQGGYGQGNQGQPNYGQDYGSSGTSSYGRSNFGSGRYERGSEDSRGGGYGGRGSYAGEGSFGSAGGWREPAGEGQQYGSGMHRGKGPKNYQRSDERVKEMLCERLHDDPEIDASEVTVNVQGGKVTLEGTVDSRRTKNAIEDIAEQIGSQEVQNNLRVQRMGERSGMEAGKASMSTKSSMGGDDEQAKQKRN